MNFACFHQEIFDFCKKNLKMQKCLHINLSIFIWVLFKMHAKVRVEKPLIHTLYFCTLRASVSISRASPGTYVILIKIYIFAFAIQKCSCLLGKCSEMLIRCKMQNMMQGLSNALPIKTLGQKVAENEGFEFKQNNSKKVAFFGIFRQKWQPSFNVGIFFLAKIWLSWPSPPL